MKLKAIALIASSALVLIACGSRVVPLEQIAGPGFDGDRQDGATTTTSGGKDAVAGVTTGASTAPVPGTKAILPNCTGGASDTGVTATTIKLGLVASLTGPLPGQFDSAVEAVDSYFKGLNDAGGICGRKVQLLIRDDNGNGATDLKVAKELAEERKVFAFVGSTSAPDDSGIAAMSKKHKMPDIGFPLTWTRAENPYAFGVPGQLQRQTIGEGASGSKWLNKTFGIKQVAIFWVKESEVSILNAWAFEAAMIRATGGKISICHEQATGVLDNNFLNYVVRMQGKCDPANGPIAVYSTMENNSNIKLAMAMRDQHFVPKVYAPTFASYLPSFISKADGATEGAYIASPSLPSERLQRPQSEWSKGTYELKRYIDTLHRYYPRPKPTGSFGAPAWAMAALFVEVAKRCGADLTRTCVLKELNTMGPFTANGFVAPTRPGDHVIYTDDLIMQVRKGTFVEVRPDDRSGPKNAPDFWDGSELFNWWNYYCDNKQRFINTDDKDALYLGEYCASR